MHLQKNDGPVGRGNAPSEPGMLSLRDGAETTLSRSDGQPSEIVADAAVIIITIEPAPDAPGRWTARLASDDRILAESRAPFCDAAHALLGAGHDPHVILEMRRPGVPSWDLRAPLRAAAPADVTESPFGPKFVSHRSTGEAGADCNKSAAGAVSEGRNA
jgi:hypothetical protein